MTVPPFQTLPPRVTLIHATPDAIDPIVAAFRDIWPAARLSDVLAGDLLPALERAGRITDSIVERICSLAAEASETADAVLFTCSAFTSAIDEAKARFSSPIYKPDEAMIDHALSAGRRIGILATIDAAASAVEAQLHQRAATCEDGDDVEVLHTVVHDAREARHSDGALYDDLIADAARRLSARVDVICLAQYSMARANAAAQSAALVPVLAGPPTAARYVREQCGAESIETLRRQQAGS